MFAAMKAEYEMAHSHWRDMPPPEAGNYLVRVEIDDAARGVVMKSVRLDYYNGSQWPRMGGYVSYTSWMPLPGV